VLRKKLLRYRLVPRLRDTFVDDRYAPSPRSSPSLSNTTPDLLRKSYPSSSSLKKNYWSDITYTNHSKVNLITKKESTDTPKGVRKVTVSQTRPYPGCVGHANPT